MTNVGGFLIIHVERQKLSNKYVVLEENCATKERRHLKKGTYNDVRSYIMRRVRERFALRKYQIALAYYCRNMGLMPSDFKE